MPGETIIGRVKEDLKRFRESDHPVVELVREILWVVAVVGGIALFLFVVCGTWPAVVAVESGSMVPNMNVNDLVFVVQKDRFGQLQSFDTGVTNGYQKFGDYGDVIIYNPNGVSNIHPIIHRVRTWKENLTSWQGYSFAGPRSGYLTKGDNNTYYDQGSFIAGVGWIEPVKDEWIVGKALFSVPLLGYPTLHFLPFAAVVILLLIIHEVYVSWREGEKEKKAKKRRKKGRR
jgi:signal peptidase